MKLSLLALSFFASTVAAESITVYKSPTCGCCTGWVKIMESKGHEVKVEHPSDLQAVKNKLGVPRQLGSCHTAVIDGYLFEGHIPEQDILGFLANPPAGAKGLAVPGMPQMSPGMASPGRKYSGFKVIGFDVDGKLSLVNQYWVEALQDKINQKFGGNFQEPVVYYGQLISVAFGRSTQDTALDGQINRAEELEEIAAI